MQDREQAPARASIDQQYRWRLEDIFESDQAWEQAFQAASQEIAAIGRYEGKLQDPEALLAALEALYGAQQLVERLYAYARMRRDEDNNAGCYQALCDRAQNLLVTFSTAGAYLAPELMELPQGMLEQLAGREEFSDYRVFLLEQERLRPHTLSKREEQLVAMTGEMGMAPDTIFTMLSDADMKFPAIEDGAGREVEITHANYIELMMSRERRVRRAAYEGMYESYGRYSATIPAIYSASVKGDLFYARAARFDSCLAAKLFPDNVPEAVYSNLVERMHAHLDALGRYMTLRGRLIGVDKMAMYDVYVPTTQGFELNLPFDEAYQLVVDCLAPLGPEYQQMLRTAREARWIDCLENAGKTSGAYSWGVYGVHPFVLMSYKPNLDALLTIAHEMGHAMHSYYSARFQPYPTQDYSLFVAEVASTVNEVLVLMELMERYPQREAQVYLVGNLLESIRATVFRQTMFAEFERETHRMAEAGEALTSESLNACYAALNAAYYPTVEQDGLIAREWMRIPHFYSAFYVYKYATGFSAAMALAGAIRAEGAPAVERYLRFLKSGSSLYPIDALKLAGVDMSTPEPVERALSEFDRLVERLAQLTEGV